MGKSWIRKRKLESELESVSTTPEERKALEEERHKLLQKLRRKTLRNKKNRKIRLQTAEKLVQQQNALNRLLDNYHFTI
jgi:F0F1-type ATP synthase membrane subunit b/b'